MDKPSSADKPNDESVGEKLVREAYVVGAGLGQGFAKGAEETLNGGWSSVLQAGGSIVLGAALGLAQSRAGILRLGAEAVGTAMGISFLRDLSDPARLANIGNALSDTWSSDQNTAQSIGLISDNAGKFAFDMTSGFLLTGGGMGAARSYAQFRRGGITGVPEAPLGAVHPLTAEQPRAFEQPQPAEPLIASTGDRLDSAFPLPEMMPLATDLAEALKPHFDQMTSTGMKERLAEVNAAERDLNILSDMARGAIELKLPESVSNQFIAPEEFASSSHMEGALRDHPQELRLFQDYMRQRQPLETKISSFNKDLRTMLDGMETSVNGALASDKLPATDRVPPVKLEAADSDDLRGAVARYVSGRSAMRVLTDNLVNGADPERGFGSISHELRHHNQLSKIIWNIMDESGVGVSISPQEHVNLITRAVLRLPHVRLGESFIADLAAIRQGQHLPAEGRQYALEQEASWKNIIDPNNPLLEADKMVVARQIEAQKIASARSTIAGYNILESYAPTKMRQIYGGDTMPPALASLKELDRRIDAGYIPEAAWNEDAAQKTIMQVLQERKAQIDTQIADLHRQYRLQIHERDADMAGQAGEIAMLGLTVDDHPTVPRFTQRQMRRLLDDVANFRENGETPE